MKQVKTGLALGAGAAKGWAHIGVTTALARPGLRSDIIAGCSIGARVGAAYARNRLIPFKRWAQSFHYRDVLRLMVTPWHSGGLLRGKRVFNNIRRLIPCNAIENMPRQIDAVAIGFSTEQARGFTEGALHTAVSVSLRRPGPLTAVRHNDYWLVGGASVNPAPVSLTCALGRIL
jgi:NTE family protein